MAKALNTPTFVMNLTETFEWDGRTMLEQPLSCGDTVYAMLCCCRPWADYSDGDKTLRFRHPCTMLPCCDSCNWKVAHADKPAPGVALCENDFKDIGAIVPAGACDNGCLWCACPCLVCSFDNLKVASFHSKRGNEEFEIKTGDDGNADFTIRRDVACGDSCMVCCGALTYPCFGPLSWCCKYITGTPAVVSTLPFYDKEGTTPYGEFKFASRILCVGCCCVKVPVRYIVNSNAALNSNYDAVLGLVPILVRGLPTPCALCTSTCAGAPFPTPSGIDCFDRGLKSTTHWMDFQTMCKDTAPAEDNTAKAPGQQMQAPTPNQA